MNQSDSDVEIYKRFQKSPLYFIFKMWGLTLQPLKKDYKKIAEEYITIGEFDKIRAEWFEPFVRGKHLTWQQWLFFSAVEKAIRGEAVKRISIRSGHGSGKSAGLSMLAIWFLFCFKNAQISCTAPTSQQMHDVLWKEVSLWLDKMPKEIKNLYDWSNGYLKIKENPDVWFARAVTARRENPEALAGTHGDYVMLLIDEACHDDKTEILTSEGWKRFYDLDKTEDVMTLNQDGSGKFQRPTNYQEYDFSGELNEISSKTGDFSITDKHNLWVKTKKAGYRKIAIKDIPNTDYYISRVIKWVGKETVSEDLMELWGWFLSEGCLQKVNDKNYSVVISQDIEENRQEIISLMARMGYKPSAYKHSISVHNRDLCKYFEGMVVGGFKSKFIPREVKNQSPRLLNIFLDAFSKGDGYKKGNREILYTSSPRLADDLQEAVLKTGKNSTIIKRKINGQRKWIKDHWATSSCDGYVVSRSHIATHLKINRNKIVRKPYSGKIYCVTTPNGIVMTRRNGKAIWSGNSGVPQEVFNTAEGSLTNKNILVVMISNPTRLIGYFYDSHHSDKENWQTLRFNSEESPIVDKEYVERIAKKHGADSDEYKIRVLGLFPKADAVDEWGYVPLLIEKDLNETEDCDFVGRKKMGIDPSGEGKAETKWVVRDEFKAKIVATEKTSTEKSIAQKTLSLMEFFGLKGEDLIVDNFGTGANVAKELALNGTDVNAVNVGDSPEALGDKELYENKRAEMFSKMKKWLRSGGELVRDEDWKQLLMIRLKRTLKGSKIQIMPKQEMKKKMGVGNLDAADALALTFLIPDKPKFKQYKDDFKPRSKYQGK